MLRVGTWNVNAFNPKRSDQKVLLLGEYEWDVLLLQEVGPEMREALGVAGYQGAFAIDQIDGLPAKSHGVAVLVRNGLSVSEEQLVSVEIPPGFEPRLDFGARLMQMRVSGGAKPFDAVAFHAFHAAGGDENRLAKMALYEAAHQALRGIEFGVAGFDGNCWGDTVEPTQIDADHGWYEEHCFLQPGADHGFVDAYLAWLRVNPDELARLRKLGLEGEDGCLAVTYQRSNNNQVRTNRMDRVYCTPGFVTESVDHHYAEALSVGSDHALVIATLGAEA